MRFLLYLPHNYTQQRDDSRFVTRVLFITQVGYVDCGGNHPLPRGCQEGKEVGWKTSYLFRNRRGGKGRLWPAIRSNPTPLQAIEIPLKPLSDFISPQFWGFYVFLLIQIWCRLTLKHILQYIPNSETKNLMQ